MATTEEEFEAGDPIDERVEMEITVSQAVVALSMVNIAISCASDIAQAVVASLLNEHQRQTRRESRRRDR